MNLRWTIKIILFVNNKNVIHKEKEKRIFCLTQTCELVLLEERVTPSMFRAIAAECERDDSRSK